MTRKHGASAYRDNKNPCRCEVCRKAHLDRCKAETAARAVRILADPTLAPHGRYSTYRNWGCRCAPCVETNSLVCKQYYQRRKEAS